MGKANDLPPNVADKLVSIKLNGIQSGIVLSVLDSMTNATPDALNSFREEAEAIVDQMSDIQKTALISSFCQLFPKDPFDVSGNSYPDVLSNAGLMQMIGDLIGKLAQQHHETTRRIEQLAHESQASASDPVALFSRARDLANEVLSRDRNNRHIRESCETLLDTCSGECTLDNATNLEKALWALAQAWKSQSNLGAALHEISMRSKSWVVAKSGPSHAAREAPRTPDHCMMNFMYALHREKPDNQTAQALIDRLMSEAKRGWMQYSFTTEASDEFLLDAARRLDSGRLTALSSQVKTLRSQLSRSNSVDDFYPLLLGNNYARVFESKMMAELVNSPPAGVRVAMQKICMAMANRLEGLSGGSHMQAALTELRRKLRKQERFWYGKAPILRKMCVTDDPALLKAELASFFRKKLVDGIDCISVPYVLVKWIDALKEMYPTSVGWMRDADAQHVSTTARQGRRKIKGGLPDRADGGLTLGFQPAAITAPWMVPSVRPANAQNPLNLERTPHAAVRHALTHGIPYASSFSGSVNVLQYMLRDLLSENPDLDPKHALLGFAMFLVYDGGHSLNEVFFVVNKARAELGIDFGMLGRRREFSEMTRTAIPTNTESSDPEKVREFDNFVVDIDAYINDFSDQPTREALNASAERAFLGTFDYFEKYSPYSKFSV